LVESEGRVDMANMAAEDVLASTELFSELSKDDLARLAKLTVTRQYKAGEVIVREGELGVAFYIVSKGRVEVVKGLGSERETVIAMLGPGSFFGEMALFDNQVRNASVRAVEDTECVMLTRWDFNAELSTGGNRIAPTLLTILARRIRSLDEAATTH
jgi:CRP/FNR family transcriptional regulator, cyclic AMP receptor protein